MQAWLGIPAPIVITARHLAKRFVEQDHPAHEFLDAFGSEQQIAVGTAVGLRALDSNRLESFLACAAGLVGCEQPFASCDHRRGGFGKEISVHETVLLLEGEPGSRQFYLPGPGTAKRRGPAGMLTGCLVPHAA